MKTITNESFISSDLGAGIAAGGIIGTLAGVATGALIDYFRHNKKVRVVAKTEKAKYIALHKNDYVDKECQYEAKAYIEEKKAQIHEYKEMLSKKLDDLSELQTDFVNYVGVAMQDRKNRYRYKRRKIEAEVKSLNLALQKAISEYKIMDKIVFMKKWSDARALFVARDAEIFAAEYVRRNLTNAGKIIGGFSGLSVGALAGLLLCLI